MKKTEPMAYYNTISQGRHSYKEITGKKYKTYDHDNTQWHRNQVQESISLPRMSEKVSQRMWC